MTGQKLLRGRLPPNIIEFTVLKIELSPSGNYKGFEKKEKQQLMVLARLATSETCGIIQKNISMDLRRLNRLHRKKTSCFTYINDEREKNILWSQITES